MRIISLDPAADGAAVRMHSGLHRAPEVISACSWYLGQRNGAPAWICSWYGTGWSGPEFVRTPGELGLAIGQHLDHEEGGIDALVIEGSYVYKNPHTGLRIARLGGFIAGGIQAALSARQVNVPSAVEISPNAWRAILGLSAPNREIAKERSLAGVPVLVSSVRPILERLGYLDHITDATGIGLCGILQSADQPGFEARVASATGSKPKRRKRRA